jgi:molybdenum cofactor cytidylyltransferase
VIAAAIVLAAGESRRMGSPKALLPYAGESFLDRLTGLLAPRCAAVIVVLGAAAEEIRARAVRPATFVLNPDYARGQLASLQCGLRALPPEAEGVLFTLVDHPAVAPATLDALLRAPAPLLRVPRFEGRRGHPVWFRRELAAEFLRETGTARDVVARHAASTEFLDLDDPGIVADIDDPASFARLSETGPGAAR